MTDELAQKGFRTGGGYVALALYDRELRLRLREGHA
jgi:hypothetical protein